MYTRLVEVRAKAGKEDEMLQTFKEKIVPVLRTQAGFVDLVGLRSDTERGLLVSLTFWRTKEDAVRAYEELSGKFAEISRPLTEGQPQSRTFNVETATIHSLAAGRAA